MSYKRLCGVASSVAKKRSWSLRGSRRLEASRRHGKWKAMGFKPCESAAVACGIASNPMFSSMFSSIYGLVRLPTVPPMVWGE